MEKEKMSLAEVKNVELEILRFIDNVCRENHLTYFLAYGTLIGAVRHGGFIPWDDDIDIVMPREDYEKLLALFAKQKGNSKYECLEPLKEGYYYEFAKVIDSTTEVHETTTINARCGVWVDIFPLDGLKIEDKLSHALLLFYNRCRSAAVNASFPHKTKGILVPVEYLIWRLCRFIGYSPFLKRSIRLSKKYRYDECDIVGFASSYPAYNKYMKKEWFRESIDMEFEGYAFKAPSGYQEYLSTQYGDYMQLPPEDKRCCHQMEAYRIVSL